MAGSKATKRGGRFTEPDLPPRIIVQDAGVAVMHYYRSGDHAPPHLHVIEGTDETRIGQNGHPLKYDAPLTANEARVVAINLRKIRNAIGKIGRWHWFDTL